MKLRINNLRQDSNSDLINWNLLQTTHKRVKMKQFVYDRIEHIAVNGENEDYQHFLNFQ